MEAYKIDNRSDDEIFSDDFSVAPKWGRIKLRAEETIKELETIAANADEACELLEKIAQSLKQESEKAKSIIARMQVVSEKAFVEVIRNQSHLNTDSDIVNATPAPIRGSNIEEAVEESTQAEIQQRESVPVEPKPVSVEEVKESKDKSEGVSQKATHRPKAKKPSIDDSKQASLLE